MFLKANYLLNITERRITKGTKQVMRTLARNMAFLMKSIELGKKEFGLPETEEHIMTNFIG